MAQRLQRILSGAGVASRRAAEELIRAGRVTVNGTVASLGAAADPLHDEVRVDGRLLHVLVSRRYIALNKPAGYVSSRRSTHGEQTVMELIPSEPPLFPVGRLDKDTEGLLLFTDDGDWANLVTHPRYQVLKEYVARVRGCPGNPVLRRLREGVTLPDGTITSPAQVKRIGDDRGNAELLIGVIEGKKRQLRLMAQAVGHPVVRLERVRIGPIALGGLPPGQWRHVDPEEVEKVRDIARRAVRGSCPRPLHPSEHRRPRGVR